MEDGKTVVTMSLDRYKQLESAEQVLEQIRLGQKDVNGRWLSLFTYWGLSYSIINSDELNLRLSKDLEASMNMYNDVVKEVREYESKTGRKVFKN